MQMGEEKTMEIHKATKILYYDPLPLDLTREILLRLPAKSLVRFRCVSKLWSSLTTEPDFIKSFTTRSLSRPRLLLGFKKQAIRLFFSLPQHEIPDHECCSTHDDVSNSHINLSKTGGGMKFFESVHGLISFDDYTNHVVVWNPSINQHVTIPEPENLGHGTSYLGYDPCGDTYKLLWMPYAIPNRDYCVPRVLTLGAEESWRMVKGSTPTHYGLEISWKCISGVMYFGVHSNNNGYMEKTIMSFDVRFETCKLIKHPCCVDNLHMGKHYLLSYNGRLALICSLDTKLWILENGNEEKWICDINLHLPTHKTDPDGKINYQLSDATVTGEFVYVAVDDEDVHILYYDPKKNSTRTIKFEGNMYKEFERFGGGGLNFNTAYSPNHTGFEYPKSWTFARCHPNHIENLISLKNITCSKMV